MARGDRRGPEGRGPMTGKGAGFCSGNNAPGFMNRAHRGGMGYGMSLGSRGMGMGRGMGRGFGFNAYPPRGGDYYYPNAVDEREMLKAEAEGLKRNLEIITSRLEELEKEDK
jgi:hypothetical protein